MEHNEPVNPTPDNQPTSNIPPIVDSEPTPGERAAAAVASKDDKTMAMLCHLLAIFTTFIGPLIIWLIKKDQSAYVNQQGKEALKRVRCYSGIPKELEKKELKKIKTKTPREFIEMGELIKRI